ncbi:hypothetical protein B0H13DRAFT_1900467 [Mycena leptocephala]|nr:hypothetical protein B0H13DRAFT_1900467 [Mycena leptocephala]
MPHVSLRQKLLRGAYKYAAKLQRWRKQEREQHLAEEVEITTGLGIGDALYDQPLGQDEGEDSDVSSVSSASSISSISSADSSYDFDIDSMDLDLDTERETLYKIRYEAIRRHIERLENTRVVNPNTVHKLSQLYLVLEDYKTDDAKRFRRNLRVMPETFDSLVEKFGTITSS